MSASALFGLTFVGTLVWVANPEAATALFAAQRRWNPVVIGLVAAAGQAAGMTALFLFGDQLRRRWRWFDRQCEKVRARYGERMARNALAVAALSGVLGLPPVSVTSTLAPGLTPRAYRLLPVMVLGRAVRFSLLAAIALGVGARLPWQW